MPTEAKEQVFYVDWIRHPNVESVVWNGGPHIEVKFNKSVNTASGVYLEEAYSAVASIGRRSGMESSPFKVGRLSIDSRGDNWVRLCCKDWAPN